ncbi:MAG TPA: hypothetical protein VLX92_18370 [Kofleriaceae bacterium]|nr:hypothetical protein [Kofleriaceae bacterium]
MDPARAIAALADAGFDIAHGFDAERAAREPGLALLADPARRAGLLVGNSRALWPRFVTAVRRDRALAEDPHPLDRYTERAIADAARELDGRAWLGHRPYGGGFVPLQRLAAATGLAMLAPTQLAIHPRFGPWFALRAVIVFDGIQPEAPALLPPCCCAAPCTDAFTVAMSSKGPEAWRAWLAVRDACPVGRGYRYSDEQVRYHYTKDRALLG